jgi:hypothetical protein
MKAVRALFNIVLNPPSDWLLDDVLERGAYFSWTRQGCKGNPEKTW